MSNAVAEFDSARVALLWLRYLVAGGPVEDDSLPLTVDGQDVRPSEGVQLLANAPKPVGLSGEMDGGRLLVTIEHFSQPPVADHQRKRQLELASRLRALAEAAGMLAFSSVAVTLGGSRVSMSPDSWCRLNGDYLIQHPYMASLRGPERGENPVEAVAVVEAIHSVAFDAAGTGLT